MENAATNTDLAFEAGKNATGDASGKDILTRYRQLVAQKSASKAAASACSESDASSISDPETERFGIQDLGSDLEAEIEGGSDKENVDPIHTMTTIHGAKTPSRDAVAKILGSIDGSISTAMFDADESPQMLEGAETPQLDFGKLFIPKKVLDDQWAMVGEHDSDSEEAPDESNVDEREREGVRQDPGELLSTGILEASFLDSSAGQMSLGLSWKAEQDMLSPVNENTDTSDAIRDMVLSNTVATFSPEEASTTNVCAMPAREWDERSNCTNDKAYADVSALRDTSVMISKSSGIVTDDDDDDDYSQEDGDDNNDYPQGSFKQKQQLDTTEGKYPQTPNDQGVAPLSPLSSLRKNAMELALEESQMYTSKIRDLTSAKDAAEAKAKREAKRRRECEKRIDELLALGRTHGGDSNEGKDGGTPRVGAGAGPDDLNRSTVISPLSKSPSEDSDILAASLMERNKTLVKEVRFADQTCVELAERNSALQKEVERLSESLTALKNENGTLHESVIKSSQHGARMEESRSNLAALMSEQKEQYEAQLTDLRAKAADNDATKRSLDAQLAASIARADTLQERLSMKAVVDETSKAEGASVEREEMDQVKAERESLRLRCSDLEAEVAILRQDGVPDQPITPQKATEESSPPTRTPTSTVLARTLQSELQRGHSANDRFIEAEKRLAEANVKLESMQIQLEASQAEKCAAKEETKVIQDRLREYLGEQGALERVTAAAQGTDDVYDNDSNGNISSQELVCNFSISEDANNSVNTDKVTNTNDEVVDLRGQLHKVLFEKKALLIEVSSYKASIKELESTVDESRRQCFEYEKKYHDQLKQVGGENAPGEWEGCMGQSQVLKDAVALAVRNIMGSYRIFQNEAVSRLCLQQQRVALLSDTMFHLQSQLDFQTTCDSDESATLSTAGPNASLSNCVDAESPEKVLDVNEFEEDNVLNATFTFGLDTKASGSPTHSSANGNSMEVLEEARLHDLRQEQDQGERTVSENDSRVPKDDSETLAKMRHMQDELHAKEESIERAEIENQRLSNLLDTAKTQLDAEKESILITREMYSLEKSDLLSRISKLEGELKTCERGRMRASEAAASAQQSKHAEIENLRVEIEELRSKLEVCSSQYQDSQSELESFRTEAADMLNDLELQKEALEEENNALSREVKDIRSKTKAEGGKVVSFQEAAKSAEAELRKASGEVLLTRATMSKLKTENERLSFAAEQSDREHRSSVSRLQSATQKINLLEKERSKLLDDINHATTERANLAKLCEDHLATIEKYKSLRATDAKLVEDLRSALQQTTAQTNELKLSFVTVNDKLANAMERNLDSENTIQDAQETIQSVEKDRNEQRRSAAQHKEELLRVRDELSAVRGNAQRMFSEQDTTIRELKDMNEQCLSERDSLMKEAEEALCCLQRQITAASVDMRQVASRLCIKDEFVHRALERVQESACQPREGLLTLRPHAQDRKPSVVSDAYDALLQLRAVLAAVDGKLSEHSAIMFDLDLEKQRLTSEVTSRFRTEEELKLKLAEARDRERRVEGRLKQATQEIESHAAKLLKSRESITSLESKLVSSMEDCERLRGERDSARTASKENVSIELERKAEELSKLTSKYASLERKSEKLRDYIKSLTQKCEEWAQSFRSQSSDLARTKQAHEDLVDKMSQMKTLVEGCESSACSECRHLRSAISAKCEVRAALLRQDMPAVPSISWQLLKPSS